MTNPFKISLRPNEKIYVNGAVLRFDRRTSVEFLNDVSFLLESHIMQLEDAVSPIQHLYYIIQIMLMTPDNAGLNKVVYASHLDLIRAQCNEKVSDEFIHEIDKLVNSKKYYEAMKYIRTKFDSIVVRREHRDGKDLDKYSRVPIKAA
jgi:flagellar biosynthesis repressor protein FlbT